MFEREPGDFLGQVPLGIHRLEQQTLFRVYPRAHGRGVPPSAQNKRRSGGRVQGVRSPRPPRPSVAADKVCTWRRVPGVYSFRPTSRMLGTVPQRPAIGGQGVACVQED